MNEEINVFVADVSHLYDKRIFDACLPLVSLARREKCLKYRFVKDRALSLGAELLLIKALEQAGGEVEIPLNLKESAGHKLYFGNCEDLFFNLSHSGNLVACALDNKEIGVDIEKISTHDRSTAEYVCCENELPYVFNENGSVNNENFCALWTMKESFVKNIGTGIYLEPKRFAIMPGHPWKVEHTYDANTYYCVCSENIQGYRLSVCSENKYLKICEKWIRLF